MNLSSSQVSTASLRSNRHCRAVARLVRFEDKTIYCVNNVRATSSSSPLPNFCFFELYMPTPSFGDQWGLEIISDPELRVRAHYKPHTLGGTNNYKLQLPVRGLGSLMDDNGAYAVFFFPQSRKTDSTQDTRSSTPSRSMLRHQGWGIRRTHDIPRHKRGGRHTCRRQALARDSYA